MNRSTVIHNLSKSSLLINSITPERKEKLNSELFSQDMANQNFKDNDVSLPSSPDSISSENSLKKRGRPRKKDEEEEVIMSQVLRKRKYARNYRETQRKRLEHYEELLKEHDRLKEENKILKHQLLEFTEKEKFQELQKQLKYTTITRNISNIPSASLLQQLIYGQGLNLQVPFQMT
uniref:BZIP domain-containing protein n=1 Tax=Parastrongyloides trichosuri TaxID=131310 RepID=A0A0N4ZQ79_PARTI